MKTKFMKLALKEAQKAFEIGEVPVGAVIVKDDKVVAKAFNKREKMQNALFHAEILAINKACKKLKSFRLDDCEMYVTLEPCVMCSGAIVNARLKKIYYGCCDKNYGCAGGKYNFLQDKTFEHLVEVESQVLEKECKTLLQDFFAKVRKLNKLKKYIDKIVEVKIDRPVGSRHPKFENIVYEKNYGFVPNTLSGDGEEIDCYILSCEKVLKSCKAQVVAVVDRKNDVEGKLVAKLVEDEKIYSREEIARQIDFQEKFFESRILMSKLEK